MTVLPRLITEVSNAAKVAVRLAKMSLPLTYCSPQCPDCRRDVATFDEATSCVANSSFVTNCGSCQQCIITYQIENDTLSDGPSIQLALQFVLDLCLNSSIAAEIVALESQASKISGSGAILNTSAISASVTASATASLIPTADSLLANQTAIGIASTTSSPTSSPATSTETSLNNSWVVGPVLGSILGILTVFIVIYLTRRKQRRETPPMMPLGPPKTGPWDTESSGSSAILKAQLPSDPVPIRELETTEVYELAAVEPVGSELTTPRDQKEVPDWPLPLSPLPALFAMTELRDERVGKCESVKHETYYNP